jgi:hypothetical protein
MIFFGFWCFDFPKAKKKVPECPILFFNQKPSTIENNYGRECPGQKFNFCFVCELPPGIAHLQICEIF